MLNIWFVFVIQDSAMLDPTRYVSNQDTTELAGIDLEERCRKIMEMSEYNLGFLWNWNRYATL